MNPSVRRNETPRPILPTLFAIGAVAALTALTACSASGGDSAITSRVKTVLQADLLVDASAIRVTTERGVVTLDGSVAGEDAHRTALDLAQRVEGVRQVRDRLSVTPATPQPADAPPPEPALGHAPANLGGLSVEERTREQRRSERPTGDYGLMAAVVGSENDLALDAGRSEAPIVEPAARRERAAAGDSAAPALDGSSTRGDEALAVAVPGSPALLGPADGEDRAITARVREALVDLGGRVQVLTRSGVVTLSGAVDTELEKSEAIRVVRGTRGVAGVEDRLIVLQF